MTNSRKYHNNRTVLQTNGIESPSNANTAKTLGSYQRSHQDSYQSTHQGQHQGSQSLPTAVEFIHQPSSTHIVNDPWFSSYADRAEAMRASEVRALFSVASRPEVVSLAGGMPYLDSMPFDELSEHIAKLIRDKGSIAWQYGSAQGDPHLREQVLDIMALEHITDVHPDDVVITNGSQNALDLITRIMCNPGDVVLAEAPNYVGALAVFQSFQVEVANVALDSQGIIPERLEETIMRLEEAGKRIKFLYTVPNFHNPSGATLSLERRPQVLEIAKRHHILIVEDNPYGLLSFNGVWNPALRSMNADHVVYLSSFSKIIAPGMRIAWMVAPPGIRQKLILANEASILCPSNMAQMTISTYLDHVDWKSQIKEYSTMYGERCNAMDQALKDFLPYCSWNKPQGGFFMWVKIPDGLDSRSMLPRAITAKVAYVSGTGFYMTDEGHDHMRLSFCYPTKERIREGVRRLSTVMNSELATMHLFGLGRQSSVETDAHQSNVSRETFTSDTDSHPNDATRTPLFPDQPAPNLH